MPNIKNVLSIVLLLLVVACGSNDLTVTAQFLNTQDIKQGHAVYLDSKVVGKVVNVQTDEDKTVIKIAVQKDAIKLIDANAAVVINRLKKDMPLEVHNRSNNIEPLQDGQSLKGLDSMFQLGAWMVGDAIQIGSKSVTEYVDAFQKYLQSDQFQQDKQQVQQQIESAKQAAKEAINVVNTEMNSAMQDIADAEQPAAQAVEQLGEELSPVVEDLAKSGSAIIKELEKLTESLEQSQQNEQQSGQVLLDSLISMLEKLNNSMEKGSQQQEEQAK